MIRYIMNLCQHLVVAFVQLFLNPFNVTEKHIQIYVKQSVMVKLKEIVWKSHFSI